LIAAVRQALHRFQHLAGANPVLVAFMVFLVAALVVVPASMIFWFTDAGDFLKNVVAESHGTLFDLFIIGWFLMWLSKRAERSMTARRYREEIDDFLAWRSHEASHRIAINVRKLNRAGVRTGIRLSEAFLEGVNLKEAQLRSSDMWGADFTDAVLEGCDLSGSNVGGGIFDRAHLQRANLCHVDGRGATFPDAELKYTDFRKSDLRGVDLTSADLQFANLADADLRHGILLGASLRQAVLTGADLRGADLRDANLENADLSRARLADVDFRNADLHGAEFGGHASAMSALSRAKSLDGARLDEALMMDLRRLHPHLFSV
jgi:uncharacterized protein YjbI with pentapeptide repeats